MGTGKHVGSHARGAGTVGNDCRWRNGQRDVRRHHLVPPAAPLDPGQEPIPAAGQAAFEQFQELYKEDAET